MIFNILSYQQKTSGRAIAFQLLGGFLFSVNFFMLGAIVGGIMNALATFRAIVFLNKKRFHSDHIAWLVGFISAYVICYILTFTAFGEEFSALSAVIELLPIIGMTATTVGFRLQNAKAIRRSGLISSPSWLIYNTINAAVGAIICEVLSLISIVVGVIRYDIKAVAEDTDEKRLQ